MSDATIRIIHLCDDIQLQVMFGCNGKHGFQGTVCLSWRCCSGNLPAFLTLQIDSTTPRLHVTNNHVIFDAAAFQSFLRSIDKNL